MTRFADRSEVEVSVDIAAPPSAVWDLVTDINLPARFQREFRRADWIDPGPALGAAFRGHNARKDLEWETTSWVVSYEPERAFGWAVSDRDNPGATWTYRLDPVDAGTRLTFHRVLGPGPSGITRLIARYPDAEEAIIARRDAEHRAHMQAVVEGIKALAESE